MVSSNSSSTSTSFSSSSSSTVTAVELATIAVETPESDPTPTETKPDPHTNVFIEQQADVQLILTLEDQLDKLLGFFYWKRYVASAFWANISTPVNLTMTVLTALTTAQLNSSNLMSASVTSVLSYLSFGLTVFNTFFRPHLQMTQNLSIMKEWNKIGNDFEMMFFNRTKYHDLPVALNQYKTLQERINFLRKSDTVDTSNFLTDLIHCLSNQCCLRDAKWLDKDMKACYRKRIKHK